MEKIWSVLVHLGTNLWLEKDNTSGLEKYPNEARKVWKQPASPVLRFDEATWEAYRAQLAAHGVNAIVLDIADGLVYPSHPELAVEGAWTAERLAREGELLRGMGIEVIPKLNFSTTHDVWLGEYAKMVSSQSYYDVCRDLINDVCAILHPRYFHLGMDEENYEIQQDYRYVVIRQREQWWHDLRYLVDCVEKNGARAMMWSDYAREHTEEVIENCPKSVIQCVWYYFSKFYGELSYAQEIRVRPLKALSEAGFDLFPGGSLEYEEGNFHALAAYCKKEVAHDRILGFLQTTWEAVTPEWTELLRKSAETVGETRAMWED